jgi:hypothetical protein
MQRNHYASISCLRMRITFKKITYGVLFGVVPPVGPAVPDSQIVYVLSSLLLTFSANPETIWVVGPL